MRYWLSDFCLVLAQWLADERPLNRAGRIGVFMMIMAVIVWMALICSTADSENLWAAWWWSTKIAGCVAGVGLLMALFGAAIITSKLR